jgi:hypothetical protein
MTCLDAAAQGRAKRAVRAGVALAGGIEGAAIAVGRGKSQVGRWHALADADLPTVDAALALDEVAVAGGRRPAIIDWMSAELGGVFLPLPGGLAGVDGLLADAAHIAEGAGSVVSAIAGAVADGQISDSERRELIARGDALVQHLAAMTARLRADGAAKGAV